MKTPPSAIWTLDDLTARVAAALTVDYDGASSGRVRDVPDRRTVRYYTTLGLIDRPAAFRGRTALYGRRHLLQLAAIKRLQAEGLPLHEIQRRLLNLPDAALEPLARVPEAIEPVMTGGPLNPGSASGPGGLDADSASGSRSDRGRSPAAHLPTRRGFSEEREAPPRTDFWKAAPALPTLRGLVLADGVTLLLADGHDLAALDPEALRRAAQPLLDLLRGAGRARPEAANGTATPDDLPPPSRPPHDEDEQGEPR